MIPAGPTPPDWSAYFTFLISWEGSTLEDVPGDSGGLTKYGIDHASHPGVNIAALTARTASEVHLADYGKTAAGKLPLPLNYAYFDFAMNAGERAAARALQRAVGANDDGVIGPKTLGATDRFLSTRGYGAWMLAFSREREMHYRNLAFTRPSLSKFLNGWLNRTSACRTWCVVRLKQEGAPA